MRLPLSASSTAAPLLACLALATACSDYGIKGPAADNLVAPDIQVSPDAITTVVCGADYTWLTISNLGDAALLITALTVSGDGWTVDTTDLPESLAAGDSVDLPVTIGPGDAMVFIESNDPDEALVQVPLSATADAAPIVRILDPGGGDILAAGEALVLQGQVSDAEDPADSLTLAWSSDVDGLLSADPADADGNTSVDWAPALRSPGPHRLFLSATDSCGQETIASTEICQDEGYTVDELDISSWNFEGSATWDAHNEWVRLTTAETNQVGTAFAIDETITGDAVDIRFAFWIGGGTGADGISLTVIDADRMTGFLGGTGCGIGYGGDAGCTSGPALPGWSVEVDTYFNDGQDPTSDDHVMFTFDGDVDDPAIWATLPEMEDTGWHVMQVTVAAPRVTVRIDDVVYIDNDLSGHFAFDGYVGFTAGTGGQTNEHRIDSLEVTAHTCE